MTWQELKTRCEDTTNFFKLQQKIEKQNENNDFYATFKLPIFFVNNMGEIRHSELHLYQMKDETGNLIDEHYFFEGNTPEDNYIENK